MSSPPTDCSPTVAFDVLADATRRSLLSVLLERTDPTAATSASSTMAISTLATEVATVKYDCPIVTDDQCTQMHVSLSHRHVPRLEDIGLVTCDDDGNEKTVSLTDHPVLEVEWVRSALDDPTGGSIGDEDVLDRTFEALRSPRRRTVCSVLARRRDAVPVIDLAAMVAAAEGGDDTRLADVSEQDCEPVATELVHTHLPMLADAGLVEYDRSNETVAIDADALQWRANWLAESPVGDAAKHVLPRNGIGASSTTIARDGGSDGDATNLSACWTIEGVENIVTRAHEIVDNAEDELFVMVPDDGILQQQCLERWRAAVDRGVDVYVGSRSAQIRDTVRSAVPQAVVCEPRLDWINFPVDQVHHGRVVFADREAAMVMTGANEDATDESHVTAITGQGTRNALVLLVCEHLGPRLDRLEFDDEHDGTAAPLPM
ncbi:TrmB family transcriptional regulator sugar-binding domain-containing protein [Natrialbaceae archaeon A-arb3/5]